MPYLIVTLLRVVAVSFGVLVVSWAASHFLQSGDIYWLVPVAVGYLGAHTVWYVSKLAEERYRYNIKVPFPFNR